MVNFFSPSLIFLFRTYHSNHFSSLLWYASNDYDRFPFQQFVSHVSTRLVEFIYYVFSWFATILSRYFSLFCSIITVILKVRQHRCKVMKIFECKCFLRFHFFAFVLPLFDRLLLRFPEFWTNIDLEILLLHVHIISSLSRFRLILFLTMPCLSIAIFTRQPLHDEYSLPRQHCVILFGLWLFSFNLMIKEGRDEVISGMKTERDLEIVFWTKVAVKKIVTHLELIFWFVIYLWYRKGEILGYLIAEKLFKKFYSKIAYTL